MSDDSITIALCLECGRTRPFKPGRGTAEQRWVAVYAAAIVHEYTSAARLGADIVDPESWARWADEAATVADLAEDGFAALAEVPRG